MSMRKIIIKTMEITSYLVNEDRTLTEVNEKIKVYLPYFYEYIDKLRGHLLELQLRLYNKKYFKSEEDVNLLANVKLIKNNIKLLSKILNNIEIRLDCLLLKIEGNDKIDNSLFNLLGTIQDSMTNILENNNFLDLEVLIDHEKKNRLDIFLTKISRYIKAIKGLAELNKELNINMITLTNKTDIIQIKKVIQVENGGEDIITYTLYHYPNGLDKDYSYTESFASLPLAIDKGNKILNII